MAFSFPRARLAFACFVVASTASAPRPISACDPVMAQQVEGAIGDAPVYPRNFVFVGRSGFDAGLDPRFSPHPVFPWRVPNAPFEAETTVDLGFESVLVGTTLDETPPSEPLLHSARYTWPRTSAACGAGCGFPLAHLQFTPAADAQTQSDDLGYLVFGGRTREEAATTERPLSFMQEGFGGEILDHASIADADANVFLTIAAVDLAGNVSERSEVVRVQR